MQYFVMWICHNIFIYLPTDGHLGCLQLLAMVNRAIMNLSAQVFFEHPFLILLGIYPGVALLGHTVILFLSH